MMKIRIGELMNDVVKNIINICYDIMQNDTPIADDRVFTIDEETGFYN